VLGLAIVNDVLLLTGVVTHTVFLHPHGSLVYAFGVALTLLLRYRLAAGALAETESSLRERTEELRHSHAELRLVQDELVTKQQLAAVGELAAAIAHEVRNPLAVIVNAVAGLRRVGLGEGDRTMLLDIVEEEAARLNHLVTDLLRFARPVNVQRSATSLAELARRSEVLKRQPGVELVIDEAPAARTVLVDPGLFRLVFDNLIDNACQAMSGGGRLDVIVRPEEVDAEPCVRIVLRDSGDGMDATVLARAQNPFFTTRPSGTGLGLPIVQRIVEGHGGRLILESQPGRGTTVTLFVPEQGPNDLPPSGAQPIKLPRGPGSFGQRGARA
jgi:signal transduction histidine kinase